MMMNFDVMRPIQQMMIYTKPLICSVKYSLLVCGFHFPEILFFLLPYQKSLPLSLRKITASCDCYDDVGLLKGLEKKNTL